MSDEQLFYAVMAGILFTPVLLALVVGMVRGYHVHGRVYRPGKENKADEQRNREDDDDG